ncbi:MAG: hypothetical protein JXX28_05340 [Deltaproteobacteria bacterium]|nr:hypothetical protein [Deltaproteobacteria bacterium]
MSKYVFFSLGALALLGGCPKNTDVNTTFVPPSVTAPTNMWLRTGFDTDPSGYLGRFVSPGTASLDETAAMPLSCSQFISYKKVDGGGVRYDQYYNASSEAAANVGVPVLAGMGGAVGAQASASQVVRIAYELTGKMVADIADPAAFEACCKQAADQCTDLYLGEFIEGRGAIYYASSQDASAHAGGTYQGVGAETNVKDGVAWHQSIEFPNPVYFAFKTTKNNYTGEGVAEGGCGPWTDAPPRSSQGQYFVGISNPSSTERVARDDAMGNARLQAVKFLGEQITAGSFEETLTTGDVSRLSTALDNDEVVQRASAGIARMVKDESWCIEPEATPEGKIYVAKTLVLLPKSSMAEAAASVVATASGSEE